MIESYKKRIIPKVYFAKKMREELVVEILFDGLVHRMPSYHCLYSTFGLLNELRTALAILSLCPLPAVCG